MNNNSGIIILAVILGIWLLLFIAARFTPLSKQILFLKEYWWLNIPLISWLLTVFPLVLPPIPLGPIALSLAWSRRRMFAFYKKGCEYLGKPEAKHAFPWGWMVNLMINLWDMATLGLAQLFATASLLKEMIQKDGTEAERAEIDPVWWCFKWLLMGNVFFLAAYFTCPGIIFAPLLIRMEQHYELHRGTGQTQDQPGQPGLFNEARPSAEHAREADK
jgi:hypothetical protein